MAHRQNPAEIASSPHPRNGSSQQSSNATANAKAKSRSLPASPAPRKARGNAKTGDSARDDNVKAKEELGMRGEGEGEG
jgi:hypothetical protein